nr:MAG TPA: hypothetical protein [Caudoviricetes sp.]
MFSNKSKHKNPPSLNLSNNLRVREGGLFYLGRIFTKRTYFS